MALFNESLEGRFSQLVQRLHSMKGASPIPQVAPEIVHGIQLNDEVDHIAHLFLARVTRYSSGPIFQAADATHFSGVQFQNPANSGVLAQVEVLLAGLASTDAVTVRTAAAAIPPGTTGASTPLDSRENTGKKSALINVAGNQVVGLSGAPIETIQGDLTVTGFYPSLVTRGMIIGPGASLTVFGSVINKAITVLLVHRERAVSPAELLL